MKNHLGKIALFVLLPILLVADTKLADFTLHASKKELVVKEATELVFEVKQKDHTNSMFFFFEPKKSDAYIAILLDQNIKKSSVHESAATFVYLLFPLKSGEIQVDFDFTIEVANDNTLTDVYTGGRDGVKWMNTTKTKTKIEPLHLHVSALKQKVDLVGDFTLKTQLQKSSINQYGKTNILYTLEGEGYDEKNIKPLASIQGVESFSQVAELAHVATPTGVKLKRQFTYALLGKHNFTIPAAKLTAYSVTKHRYYTLTTPSYPINVTSPKSASLLDKRDFPQESSLKLADLKQFFAGVILFFAGFATAKLAPKLRLNRKKERKFEDIKKSSSPQELILVLMQNYPNHPNHAIKEFIDALEMLAYKNSDKNFKEIKTKLLEKLM